METAAFLAQMEKSGNLTRKVVNVPNPSDGMVLLVLSCLNVTVGRCGMFILIAVNVSIISI